jgi:hypothetical protein
LLGENLRMRGMYRLYPQGRKVGQASLGPCFDPGYERGIILRKVGEILPHYTELQVFITAVTTSITILIL